MEMVKPKVSTQPKVDTIESLNEDIDYIKKLKIAKQKNGYYCKLSSIFNSVVITNMTFENMLKYWISQHKYATIENKWLIANTIIDKLENDLIPLEDVLSAQKKSKDPIKETQRIIKEITSTYSPYNQKEGETYESIIERVIQDSLKEDNKSKKKNKKEDDLYE